MEHILAVGDVLAIWGTRDAGGVERQYVIQEQNEHGAPLCELTGPHFHLTEITILVTGYVMITDVYLGDPLIIGDVKHRWIIRPGEAGFILVPEPR